MTMIKKFNESFDEELFQDVIEFLETVKEYYNLPKQITTFIQTAYIDPSGRNPTIRIKSYEDKRKVILFYLENSIDPDIEFETINDGRGGNYYFYKSSEITDYFNYNLILIKTCKDLCRKLDKMGVKTSITSNFKHILIEFI